MVGDFGLSKMIQNANTNLGAENNIIIDSAQSTNAIIIPPSGYQFNGAIHTAGVGTASYASPEQVTSKTYGTAADIYSLGLILLELFSNFTSEHERAKGFHECRHNRELAPRTQQYHPEVSALILACTQADWSRRPTASTVLASGMFQEKGGRIDMFRSELRALQVETSRKDALIQSQREQMKEKDEIIESLRHRLAKVEINDMSIVESDEKARDKEDPVDIQDSGSSSTHDDYQ